VAGPDLDPVADQDADRAPLGTFDAGHHDDIKVSTCQYF
jgi:hypothetical protein